jgi:hypothetical protein
MATRRTDGASERARKTLGLLMDGRRHGAAAEAG